MDKRSSKNKNVVININILTHANFSGKRIGIVKAIIALSITGVICYKLFTMSNSDFVSVLDTLLEHLSSMDMFH